MATFDQLPAEQRAIIELVVARGRSYDALADVLQVPASRVRELARDALVELSPVTGGRVDPQWRGQVADYLLGQQTSAESTATRAHLKRSEAARTWALSVMDALDTLYANGNRPDLPDGEAGGAGGTAVEEVTDGEAPSEGGRTEKRARARRGAAKPAEKAEKAETKPAEKKPAAKERKDSKTKKPVAGRSVLSPAARSALRRRRVIGALLGALALAALIVGVLFLTGVFGGDGGGSDEAAQTDTTETAPGGAQGEPELVGQLPLEAVDGAKARGNAYILQQGDQRVLGVQAQLPALPASQRKAAYNVWLYNSPRDAESIGAQFTTPKGEYQGVGPLPENYERFKFIDVSRQPFNNRTGHSGNSVLRGRIADLQQPPPQGEQQPPQPQPEQP